MIAPGPSGSPPEGRVGPFVLVTFVVAAIVGIATFYFGVHGQLGAGIP